MKRGENKKSFNKSSLLIITVIIIAIILLFLIIKNFPLTSKVIEKPPVVPNCSNESIKAVWENIFKGNSSNIKIVELYNASNQTEMELIEAFSELYGECPAYVAYEINGNQLKMLNGMKMWFLADIKILLAYVGNFNEGVIANLTNESNPEFGGAALAASSGFIFEEKFIKNNIIPRNINTTQEAQLKFESVFNISFSNWTKEYDEELENLSMYNFIENETIENITLFGEEINPQGMAGRMGVVLENYSLEVYIFSQASVLNENLYKEFENWTSPINTSLQNITIKVNNSKVKMAEELEIFSEPRSGIQKLEIQQNNQTIIETEINFTEEDLFDFTKIILKKQEASSIKGYVIINGLNYTKNITLDKLNNESESVCIKDSEISNINEISEDCSEQDEYLVECPGSIGNFTCTISENKFIITGLTHSAVIEILPEEEPCISNWQCDEWSDYEDSCGYRTCTDLNNCENISGMPLEYLDCPVCIPDWECTEFSPEKCPKTKVRTRNCNDLNDCGTLKERPNLKESCERDTSWIWILISIVGGIIILLIILLIIKRNKRQDYDFFQEQNNPRSPPRTEEEYYKQSNGSSQNLEQSYKSNQIFVPRTRPK